MEENNKRWEENIKRWEEANKRFSRIELELGTLTEATLLRCVWEDPNEKIKFRGEEILNRYKNLVLETNRSRYVIEVKIKLDLDIEDVRNLMSKVEVASKRFGKPITSMLAGVYIGDDVKNFARGGDVMIQKHLKDYLLY